LRTDTADVGDGSTEGIASGYVAIISDSNAVAANARAPRTCYSQRTKRRMAMSASPLLCRLPPPSPRSPVMVGPRRLCSLRPF
jgi:hypothetical protein